MARARNIKPGFFTNDELGELPALARLLFAGLWTLCDRAGRVEDRPKKIKAEVLPYDDCDADALLAMLHESGFILRYTVAGTRLIQVVKWEKHQTPHMKEAASALPAPDEHCASTVQAPDGLPPSPAPAHLIPDSLNRIPDTSSPPVHGADGANEAEGDGKQLLTLQDLIGEGVDPQSAKDWLKVRAKKRAPLTLTAWNGLRREAAAAGYSVADAVRLAAESNWQTFKAEYVQKARGSPAAPTFAQRDAADKAERVRQMTGGLMGGQPKDLMTIDMEAPDAPLALR